MIDRARDWLKKALPALRLLLGLVLLYYVLTATGGWATVVQLRDHPWVLVGLVTLPLLGAAVESIRLGLLSQAQGIRLPFWQGYQLVAIGTLFNFAVPGGTGGDVMKLYYLAAQNRKQVIEVALVVFVDRVVALLSMLALLLGLALVNWELVQTYAPVRWLVWMTTIAIVALVGIAAVSFSDRFQRSRLLGWLADHAPLGRYLTRALDALRAFRQHKTALLKAALWSLVGHLALAGMFLAVGLVLLPGAAARAIPFLALLSVLANVIPITPGGLGVGEAAAEQLFGLAGFAGGAALILAWRISMLPLCAVGGIFYAAGVRQARASAAVVASPLLHAGELTGNGRGPT